MKSSLNKNNLNKKIKSKTNTKINEETKDKTNKNKTNKNPKIILGNKRIIIALFLFTILFAVNVSFVRAYFPNDCTGVCTDPGLLRCAKNNILCTCTHQGTWLNNYNCGSVGKICCEINYGKGYCADLKTDVNNCGSCGTVCDTSKVQYSTAVKCDNGNCVATSCKSGYTVSNGQCVPSCVNECIEGESACTSGYITGSGTCPSGQVCCKNCPFLKTHWDGVTVGCCLSASQCLVDPNGNVSKHLAEDYFNAVSDANVPRCVDSGEFIGDYFCENGVWTSRTKFVALALLNFTKQQGVRDYSLFCDSFNVVSNFFDEPFSLVGGFECNRGFRGVPCFNSFCVLRFNDSGMERVLVGTALTYPINNRSDDLPFVFLRNVSNKSVNYCDNALSSDGWKQCRSKDVWYNPKLESVVFSNFNFSFVSPGFWENPFVFLVDFVKGLFGGKGSGFGVGSLGGLVRFDRLFVLEKGVNPG
ncbi:MAG: hypothetical protein ACQXXF_08525, partial [Thermoplasmatota archaeon]